MSLDYLYTLEQAISSGNELYACPGAATNKWHISRKIEELREVAQRTANSRRVPVHIFKLINVMDTITGHSFLICRKVVETGPMLEPRIEWALVDTKEAAEMMRDVSHGPSPYFGAMPLEKFKPVES